jgi:CRISPR-associated protein Csm3
MTINSNRKPLKGKIILNGVMQCETGLHIGASAHTLEIGGIDSPIVRDPITREPFVPGSSIKGKMRSLMERHLNLPFNKKHKDIIRHECSELSCPVCRLFGAAGDGNNNNLPARLIFRDMKMTDKSINLLSEIETGLQYTEWKSENSLNRITAAANPRHLERVPRGTEFSFEIIYTVESEDVNQIKEDLKNIVQLLRLVEDDALGGHGSRGYGKVRFDIQAFEGRSLDYYAGNKSGVTSQQVTTPEECAGVVEEIASFFS